MPYRWPFGAPDQSVPQATSRVGSGVGALVGGLVGRAVGEEEGRADIAEGPEDGDTDGSEDGDAEGPDDGPDDGDEEGAEEGLDDGAGVAITGFLEGRGGTLVIVGVGATLIIIILRAGHFIIVCFLQLPLPALRCREARIPRMAVANTSSAASSAPNEGDAALEAGSARRTKTRILVRGSMAGLGAEERKEKPSPDHYRKNRRSSSSADFERHHLFTVTCFFRSKRQFFRDSRDASADCTE
jgi:hypothetical protein